jgi:CBS domain-containing membrane protein
MREPGKNGFIDRLIPRGLTISPIEIIGSGLVGAGLIYMSTLSVSLADQPLFMAPLAASIAIMFTTPGMTASRSWNVIAGQFLSAVVALAVVSVISGHGGKIAAPIAFSLALLVMRLCRCLHPPACATVMIICFAPAVQNIEFLFFPVLFGSVLIVCFTWLVHVLEARVPVRYGGRVTPHHGES